MESTTNEIIKKRYMADTNTYHFTIKAESNFEEIGQDHPTLKEIFLDVIRKEFELKRKVNIFIKRV